MSATKSIATEERISSVSGLKVSPQTAIFFSRSTQRVSRIDFRNRSFCAALMCWTSFKSERNTEFFAYRDKCGNVLRETRPTIAYPGVKKIPANPLIHPDSVGHFFDVSAAGLANGGDR